jgi:predicted RecB family nuclease
VSHISYSELKNWDFCPFYHKLVYIDKHEAFKGNEYTAFGTAVHDVCEKKLLKEDFNPDETFVEKFKETLKELHEGAVEFSLDNAMKMVPQAKAIFPEIEPAMKAYFGDTYEVYSSEEMLYEPIDDHDLKFKGYVDAVIKIGDKYHIVDWKTCSWGWNAQRRNDKMTTYQLTLYKHYFCKKHNIDPKNVDTHFALLKRTAKKDRVEIFRVTSGKKKTENALKLLYMALYNITKKRYIKKRTSCTRCVFHKTELCP